MHFNIFIFIFLTIAVLKPQSSSMARKFWYSIRLMLNSSDFRKWWLLKNNISKTKSKKKSKTNWVFVFRQVISYKKLGEHLSICYVNFKFNLEINLKFSFKWNFKFEIENFFFFHFFFNAILKPPSPNMAQKVDIFYKIFFFK